MNISIIGCGWLGIPLGNYLKEKGYTVFGSVPYFERKNILEKNHILPFIWHSSQPIEVVQPFWNSDIFIILLPFKRGLENPQSYYEDIKKISDVLPSQSYVIFTSSTAIYPATNKVWSESDSIPYFSERYHVLKTVESLVLQHPLSIVLRLGGLYGPGREAKLFGQKKLFHEKERVNLIHQSHAKILIEKIIKKRLSGIYNVVSSFHPTKKEFYKEQEKNIKNNLNQNFIEKNNPLNINQNLIQSENLVVPIVKKSDTSEGNYKIISNEKLLKALNLTKNFFKK